MLTRNILTKRHTSHRPNVPLSMFNLRTDPPCVGQVLESRKWLYELKQKIVEAKARDEPVWLSIK